jgi:branched-chain amino acid transport system ATP-binding protein
MPGGRVTTGSLPPALELKDLHKRFGQTKVIRAVNLVVQPGERVGIIGPNGAGKSTLFNLISGRDAPSAGQILLNGQRIDGKQPFQVHRLGLSRSFQMNQVFPQLSVYDNLRCAVLWRLGYGYTFLRWLVDLDDAHAQTQEVMAGVRLDKKRHMLAAHLTYAEQRALDVGITLASKADVILLDEPTAGMSRSEASDFTELIKQATHGKTLLTVEHDMAVLYGLAEKIAVLVGGELLAFDAAEKVRADPRVQAAYLGGRMSATGQVWGV